MHDDIKHLILWVMFWSVVTGSYATYRISLFYGLAAGIINLIPAIVLLITYWTDDKN